MKVKDTYIYYKLKEPKWNTTIGHGDNPKYFLVIVNDIEYKLYYGDIFKSSNTVDPINKVGNLNSNTKILNIEFINKNINQFEKI